MKRIPVYFRFREELDDLKCLQEAGWKTRNGVIRDGIHFLHKLLSLQRESHDVLAVRDKTELDFTSLKVLQQKSPLSSIYKFNFCAPDDLVDTLEEIKGYTGLNRREIVMTGLSLLRRYHDLTHTGYRVVARGPDIPILILAIDYYPIGDPVSY